MKIALITGGSRGLGKSMCLKLAEKGRGILLTYHSKQQDAREVVERITDMGGKAAAFRLDVSDRASFNGFAADVKSALMEHWQRPDFDFLVHNAGIGMQAPFARTSEAQFDQLMDVHFKGPYFLTQALLPLIKDGGRIITVSSGLTRFSMPGFSAYAAMKGAAEVFTRYLAKELSGRRIAANIIAPGAIETDFGGGRVRDDPQMNRMIASSTALGRVGQADDIGGAVAALLSEESGWINGQRIEVSGGIFL